MRLTLLFALLLSVLCSCVLCSCASTGRSQDGPPAIVTYVQPSQGQRLEVVNASHTDPVELYSQTRDRANRKVASGEIMNALLERLDDQGFQAHAADGEIPEGALDSRGTGMIVDVAGAKRSLWFSENRSEESMRTLAQCVNSFIQVYNGIYALQKRELREGEDPFASPTRSR